MRFSLPRCSSSSIASNSLRKRRNEPAQASEQSERHRVQPRDRRDIRVPGAPPSTFRDQHHGQTQPGDHGFEHWFSTQNNAGPSHENPKNFVRNGEAVVLLLARS